MERLALFIVVKVACETVKITSVCWVTPKSLETFALGEN